MIDGKRLAKARESKGWTQTELGKKAKVGSASISKIELGKQESLNSSTLVSLCKTLDVQSDYLLGLSSRMRPEQDGVTQKEKDGDHATPNEAIERALCIAVADGVISVRMKMYLNDKIGMAPLVIED